MSGREADEAQKNLEELNKRADEQRDREAQQK